MKIADRKHKKGKSQGIQKSYMEKRNRMSRLLDEEMVTTQKPNERESE